ncbi:MAG TPA: DUF4388 domain-containing protein [Vicinamibacteria bacterium]|jgi:hypothetical protein|nr:DUF4388 domain-containing protein [Vicinamibacteria bacterium]
MALEGTIKDFGLPDIFQLIGLQRKTGLLTLTSEKESVAVTFENGMVVMADSSSRRLEDRLGSVLVKQGKLSKERLEEALQVQKQTLQRLGHVLATNSYITTKDLKDALQVQVSHIVFKVFRWRDGNYNFAPTDSVDYDRENFNPMSADFILMEGIRMVDEWPIIEKKIPSMDIVFRSAVDPSLIEVGAARAEEAPAAGPAGKRTPASSSNKIRLSPEEERLYRRVDGTRSVQAIIDASGAPEFEVCRTLFDLLNRNIIAKAGTGTARAEEEEGVADTVGSGIPGFVVLALVVLLSLAGIAAQLRSPFAVTGLPPLLGGSSDELLEGVSLSRLQRLDRALVAYHLIHGAPPRALDDLVASGLLDAGGLEDPWSRPYHYAPGPSGYLISAVDDSGRPRRTASIERVLSVERP